MKVHRYSRWDGRQEEFSLDARRALDAMSDLLMEGLDVEQALEWMRRYGFQMAIGAAEGRIPPPDLPLPGHSSRGESRQCRTATTPRRPPEADIATRCRQPGIGPSPG